MSTENEPGPRLAFDQETFRRCQVFARELLRDIPEMEGIAIIPSWTLPQEHVPYGIVIGRHGPLRSPKEIQHMAVQVYGCLRQQLENVNALLTGLDAMMSNMAKEIHDKQQQLRQLNAALTGTQGPDSGPAAVPRDP